MQIGRSRVTCNVTLDGPTLRKTISSSTNAALARASKPGLLPPPRACSVSYNYAWEYFRRENEIAVRMLTQPNKKPVEGRFSHYHALE